jgi:2-oxoglutarate ferredoxin oxidoreductase subunit gamma
MRGGTANCTVIVSDDMIGSPVVMHPDILIIMNNASLDKFLPRLKKGGILFYDSSLIKDPSIRKDITVVPVPATSISSATGNTKAANMVMVGALIAKTGILKPSSVTAVFAPMNKTTAKINSRAVKEGITYIENKKSQST